LQRSSPSPAGSPFATTVSAWWLLIRLRTRREEREVPRESFAQGANWFRDWRQSSWRGHKATPWRTGLLGAATRTSRTSGSTGTEISGRGLMGKRHLHKLIDFAASKFESYQKGCRKQQSWKPAKSRFFLQDFDRPPRISFLISNVDKALCCRALAKSDSKRPLSYRYKLSICYWRS
jgi:hypothetical protein